MTLPDGDGRPGPETRVCQDPIRDHTNTSRHSRLRKSIYSVAVLPTLSSDSPPLPYSSPRPSLYRVSIKPYTVFNSPWTTTMPNTCKVPRMRFVCDPSTALPIVHRIQSQDYGFDYSDEDGNETGSADVENMYYTAKGEFGILCFELRLSKSTVGKKEDNPEQALKEFRAIVEQEEEKGDWSATNLFTSCGVELTFRRRGFKALKQSTKLLFLVLRRPEDALKTYTELLAYTKSAVTRNYAEKTINSILDYVGGGKSGPVEVNVLERFYEATKGALAEAKNEVSTFSLCNRPSTKVAVQRLSAKTNLKLAKLWLDRKEYHRLTKVCIDIDLLEDYH